MALISMVGYLCVSADQAPVGRSTPTPSTKPATGSLPVVTETGLASYYADKYHGKRTASGEVFDMEKLTAAHPTLPFGTKVKVTRLDNGRTVVVRVNDRGPFIEGRIIDVSLAAARELELVTPGLAKVTITVLK